MRYALVAGVNTLVPGSPFPSGGTEQIAAAYARANISASDSVTVEVGARADSWNSEPEDPALPTQKVTYASPRAAVMWRQGRFQMQASGYYANRTPSLTSCTRFAVGKPLRMTNRCSNPRRSRLEGGCLPSSTRVGPRRRF